MHSLLDCFSLCLRLRNATKWFQRIVHPLGSRGASFLQSVIHCYENGAGKLNAVYDSDSHSEL